MESDQLALFTIVDYMNAKVEPRIAVWHCP